MRAESYNPETSDSGQAIWRKLDRDLFFVKSAVKRLEAKTSDKFDVYNPETRQVVLECREPDLGLLTKTARLLGGVHDRGRAFNLVAKIPGTNQQVFRITRGNASLTLGGPVTHIFDHEDKLIGKMKRKNLALGMKFLLFRRKEEQALLLHTRHSPVRQLLLAVALAWHRIKM